MVSKVLRSRAGGEPIIVFSRRVSGQDGSFRGVVIVSFSLNSLLRSFTKLPTRYSPIVQLIDSDMEVIVSSSPWPAGASARVTPELHVKLAGNAAGTATAVSADGIERVWSFRSVAPYPLFVRAGIERAAIIDDWLWQTLPYMAFAALALFSLSALTAFALQRVRNEERFRGALVDANAGLEQRVGERTEVLEETNRRLGDANIALAEKSRMLETINRINQTIAAEIELERLVQLVTDAATEITGAQFGAFFYNVTNEQGESLSLYTISGAPREAFSGFPRPRNTAVFDATFSGRGVVRSDDITKDPRYGRMAPHYGMPAGHLPVRSYLAVSVVSRAGEVIGGLFFGHSEPGIFSRQDEEVVTAIAAQAAIGYDKAQLYRAAQFEIAARTRSENALRESEARFRQLADSMPQIVWTAGLDGRPDYYNKKWYVYTGLDEDKITSWRSIIHPDDSLSTRQQWMHSVHTGEPCEVEYRLRHKDGEYRWHLGRALPVRDQSGEIAHWFATCTDIDDLKQAEAELAHHHDQLADHADRLQQALDDREILFKEVHHRVKNNLQVICSLVRLQATRISDPTGRDALDDTYNRIYSIGLVHEVLYGEQEAATLDLATYLGRLCATLERIYGAAERRISIEASATGTLDLVRAVPVGLLVNELLSNALKHAFPQGGPGRIWVWFRADGEFELVVGDDGVGVADEPSPARPGSLGATIIAALVQQLGATMSREGGGGTVHTVRFPR